MFALSMCVTYNSDVVEGRPYQTAQFLFEEKFQSGMKRSNHLSSVNAIDMCL